MKTVMFQSQAVKKAIEPNGFAVWFCNLNLLRSKIETK